MPYDPETITLNILKSRRDIRGTDLYREAEAFYRDALGPGTGKIGDIMEVDASPDGTRAICTGMIMERLEGKPQGRICEVDLETGDTCMLTAGPNIDRLPKYAPDGRTIAFLSDRGRQGDFQLHILDPASGCVRATPAVEGWVEYFHWSPDGRRILLGVAGHGADIGGGQGAITSRQIAQDVPSWMPQVEIGDEAFRWRRAWIYDLEGDSVRQVDAPDANIWEVVWCGDHALAAVVSPAPAESLWYTATVRQIDLRSGKCREVYQPRDQLGWLAASPSGAHVALVDTVCSDRGVVAGELALVDTASGASRRIDTRGIDVGWTEWRSDGVLLLAGHRGLDTVVATCDAASGICTERWASRHITSSGRYVSISGIGVDGDFLIEAEGFTQAPELGLVRNGDYRKIRSFDLADPDAFAAIGDIEAIDWQAPDGLTIEGWLLKPKGDGPYPLVLSVHGGPVLQARPAWLGRNGAPLAMLLKRGYAILMPNPRGSTGWGSDFARRVFNDIGGLETADNLSGVDHLVATGIADPQRLAVMGGSHGGFMTSWLITQDTRFAAAVSIAPITNWVSEHLTSNIAQFCIMALGDRLADPAGKYQTRSPVFHADKVRTPTLNICGALDRCTPPTEALQFHTALLENGVESVLVTYQEEGHGIRSFPAMVDYAARIVGWITDHLREGAERRA